MRTKPNEIEPPLALAAFDRVRLGPYRVRLSNVTSRGYFEQFNFVLELTDHKGQQRAEPPLFEGIYSAGRPTVGIAGWVDGVFSSPVRFAGSTSVDLVREGLAQQLFSRMGELIPPNGRLMIAYEAFHRSSPLLAETSECLSRGFPPLATPIGELLFYADCWLNIRDWYIPEGGREGNRKLQGNKALDVAHRQQRAEEAFRQLRHFLETTGPGDEALSRAAHRRSEMIAAALVELTSDESLGQG